MIPTRDSCFAARCHIIMSKSAFVETTNSSFPHPNFGDAVNRNVVQSEIEGGVHLNDVPPETVLEVHTKNHIYTIVHKAWGQALISGHPEYCPEPVPAWLHGSIDREGVLEFGVIGRGKRLVFLLDEPRRPVTTSKVLHVHVRQPGVRQLQISG